MKKWILSLAGALLCLMCLLPLAEPVQSYAASTTYTLVYKPHGGTGTMKSTKATYGVKTRMTKNKFQNPGYHFVGWVAKRASDGKWYTTKGWKKEKDIKSGKYSYYYCPDGATVTRSTTVNKDTIYLYAQWEPNTLTFKYDANGGEGTMKAQTITYGKKTKLRENTFTREGYVFCGWTAYRKSDKKWRTMENTWATEKKMQSSGVMTYIYPDRVSLAGCKTVDKDTIVFYAEWKKIHLESVGHRGLGYEGYEDMPEEVFVSYDRSRSMGFTHLDGDIQFTKDRVPVLSHDDTLQRTARDAEGRRVDGHIYDYTLEQLKEMDFGIYQGEEFKGEQIVTLDEYLKYCSKYGCSTDLQFKNLPQYSADDVQKAVELAFQYDMEDKVLWMAGSTSHMKAIFTANPSATAAWATLKLSTDVINRTSAYHNGQNRLFISANYTQVTPELLQQCKLKRIELTLWTCDDVLFIQQLDSYISGLISNRFHAGDVLKDTDSPFAKYS